ELERSSFADVVQTNVHPENALKNGRLRFDYGARDFELHEVQPFIAGMDVPKRAVGSDLSTIDPLAFEALVRELLERMGLEAELTKASHDGGIDVRAFNPQPIVGGRVIVQCKRYSHVVGSPVVRDLYGALTADGAIKGILITTSWF